MRMDTLPSPGVLGNSYSLLKETVKAISQIEVAAGFNGGKAKEAASLDAFLVAARSAISTFIDIVAPTVTTRVRTAVNTATITFNEALDPSTSVPLTSIAFSPARTVTAIVVTGSTMVVTATGVIATDTVTYTPPVGASADLGVKDKAGNKALTFTGVLA